MPLRSPLSRVLAAAATLVAVAAPVGLGSLTSASAASAAHAAHAKVPVIDGPDVSHYQHPGGRAINWTKVAADGKEFAISKATEGTTYTDPWFATDYAGSRAAGLVHGSYHFARPAKPIARSAREQAKFFATTVGPVTTTKTLPPALDLETTGGLGPGKLVTWAQDFLLDLRQLTGRTPMLYTYPSFYADDIADPSAIARYPLWMAEYGVTQAPVSDLWQFTDSAQIKGIHGAVDESQFRGASGLPWASLSNGTIATPWTPAAPGAPADVTASATDDVVTLHWMPGDAGTSRVRSYVIRAQPGGKIATVSPTTFSLSIPGLSTSTAYTFTVHATNDVGKGAVSPRTASVQPSIPTTLTTAIGTSLTIGATLPVQATLTRSDTGAALAGAKVLVFRRHTASDRWTQIRALTTNAKGVVATVITPKRSAQLELVYAGVPGSGRSTSFANYTVHPTVTAALSAPTVVHGTTATITGSVSPRDAGATVLREYLVNGAWTTPATAIVSKHGTFSFTVKPVAVGPHVYRIVVVANSALGAAHSARLHLGST